MSCQELHISFSIKVFGIKEKLKEWCIAWKGEKQNKNKKTDENQKRKKSKMVTELRWRSTEIRIAFAVIQN